MGELTEIDKGPHRGPHLLKSYQKKLDSTSQTPRLPQLVGQNNGKDRYAYRNYKLDLVNVPFSIIALTEALLHAFVLDNKSADRLVSTSSSAFRHVACNGADLRSSVTSRKQLPHTPVSSRLHSVISVGKASPKFLAGS